MKGYPIDALVARMGEIEGLTGNVVPISWTKTIVKKTKKGTFKPQPIAILLLADIVYWYRPVKPRDEQSGDEFPTQKKFKADKLQRSYKAFADQYGLSKRQVATALHYLKELRVIDLEKRDFAVSGLWLSNVLFIGLDVDRLIELTFGDPEIVNAELSYKKVTGKDKIAEADDKNRGTYTESTQELPSDFPGRIAAQKNAPLGADAPTLKAESNSSLMGEAKEQKQSVVPPPAGWEERVSSSLLAIGAPKKRRAIEAARVPV